MWDVDGDELFAAPIALTVKRETLAWRFLIALPGDWTVLEDRCAGWEERDVI